MQNVHLYKKKRKTCRAAAVGKVARTRVDTADNANIDVAAFKEAVKVVWVEENDNPLGSSEMVQI